MVRAIDVQDNLSKTQLLEKVQQLQKSSPEEAQKQFALETEKKAAMEKDRVNNLPKADEIMIHKDKQEEKDKKGKQKEKNKQNKRKKNQLEKSREINARNIDYLA